MLGMDMNIFSNAITMAVENTALLEAMKNFLKSKKVAIPAWVYTVLSLFFSFGLAILQCPAFDWIYISGQLPVGLLAFSLSELFYDSIWKAVKNKLDGKSNRGKNECGESERDC